MRQVLFEIPVRAIAGQLPDLPLYIYICIPIIALLAVRGIGRVRKLAPVFDRIAYAVVTVLFAVAGIKILAQNVETVPIFGYGAMLFLAFVFGVWLACWLAAREGIKPQVVMDLAIWILLPGLIGGRITYMLWGDKEPVPLSHFFRIWEGGLVFYGAAIGGAIGYVLGYRFLLRQHNISGWKMGDIIAPAAALGIGIGRVGCLLNGCCYGNVACADCPAVSFPLAGQPRFEMTARGHQTAAGFTFAPGQQARVGAVENDSAAAAAGLRPGDEILKVNGNQVRATSDVSEYLTKEWKRGKNDLWLSVKHADGTEAEITFRPLSIPLNPTQVYETVSTILLSFLLWSFYPFKRRDGAVVVLFMLGYSVHRFLDEMLRTDTRRVAFGMTLSENISLVVFAAAVLVGIWLWTRPAQPSVPPATSVPA